MANISVRNMVNSLFEIGEFIKNEHIDVDKLIGFLWPKVSLIYVSTEKLNDAIRLFEVLNNRGIPLRPSDILKSINLNALAGAKKKEKYALRWEAVESPLGDEFDRFLGHIRTILVKEKARTNLLQEFKERIYSPKQKSPALLEKGEATFDMVKRYQGHFEKLFQTTITKKSFITSSIT